MQRAAHAKTINPCANHRRISAPRDKKDSSQEKEKTALLCKNRPRWGKDMDRLPTIVCRKRKLPAHTSGRPDDIQAKNENITDKSVARFAVLGGVLLLMELELPGLAVSTTAPS